MSDRMGKIKERLNKATPGPWRADEPEFNYFGESKELHVVYSTGVYPTSEFGDKGEHSYSSKIICDLSYDGNGFGDELTIRGNLALISHAPADLAWLIGEVERLRNCLIELRDKGFVLGHGYEKINKALESE